VRLAILAALVGCYQPNAVTGAPCDPDGACPSGQVCTDGRCRLPGEVVVDTPPDTVVDASVDGPPLLTDAALDAPPPDAPDVIGCADGTREGFASRAMFPAIAGCAAQWSAAKDLRAAPTGATCGNATPCAVPADACAPGWHLCGLAGDPSELSARAAVDACTSAGGTSVDTAFVAAISHCAGFCMYTPPLPCRPAMACSEPVCCGAGCRMDNICRSGVYLDATNVGGVVTNGCGAMLATDITGVLCCR